MHALTRACALSAMLFLAGVSSVKANLMGLSISAAKDFNLVSFGDVTTPSGDIEGKAAIGGNASLTSYSIGTSLSLLTDPSTASLVVGGNLTIISGGSDKYGSSYVGGTATLPSTGYVYNTQSGASLNTNVSTISSYFNFSSAKTALTTTSTTYASYSTTGSILSQYSTLTLTGTSSTVNVFDIDASLLSSNTSVVINATAGSQVLINVSGTTVTWSGGLAINWGTTTNGVTTYTSNNTYSASNVLWNMYQATSMTFSGIGIYGSVLAPNANLTFNSGQLNGQLIVESFSGSGELHNYLFNNETGPIPEPSTYGLLGAGALTGLGLLRGLRRRRFARKA